MRYGAPQVRSSTKIMVNLYRRTPQRHSLGGCNPASSHASRGTRRQSGYMHTSVSTYQRSCAFYTTAGKGEVKGAGQPQFSGANVYNTCEIVVGVNNTPHSTVVQERPPITHWRKNCTRYMTSEALHACHA